MNKKVIIIGGEGNGGIVAACIEDNRKKFNDFEWVVAGFLNDFVVRHQIRAVVELGCGDGDQLALSQYPDYIGLDIAPTAVAICQKRYAADPTKRFIIYHPAM